MIIHFSRAFGLTRPKLSLKSVMDCRPKLAHDMARMSLV